MKSCRTISAVFVFGAIMVYMKDADANARA